MTLKREKIEMRMFTRLAVAATAVFTLGAGVAALGTGVASASVTPKVVSSDTQGLAGYYLNNDGHDRFRDVKTSFTVTSEMEQLNSTSTPGAVGVELCNPNTGVDYQLGVSFQGTGFEAIFGAGHLSLPAGGHDVCVDGAGELAPGHMVPGNVNPAGISIGDSITVELYYNQHNHKVTGTITDNTTDSTSEFALPTWGAQNFREAGVGVLDEATGDLVPPAANEVTNFWSSRVTNYLAATSGTSLTGHGDLHSVTALNSSNVPVVVPSALSSNGRKFLVMAGVSV